MVFRPSARWSILAGSLVGVAIGVVACSSNEISIGGPLQFQISSNSPVPAGDSVHIDYDVRGRSLLGMVVTWGDQQFDSVFFSGAQTAAGRVSHLYASDGGYTVTAQVTDQIEGTDTQTLAVTVQP